MKIFTKNRTYFPQLILIWFPYLPPPSPVSVSLTHTQTTGSLSFLSISLPLIFLPPWPPSLSIFPSISLSPSHSFSLPLSHSHFFSPSLSLSLIFSFSFSLPLILSIYYISLSPPLSLSLIFCILTERKPLTCSFFDVVRINRNPFSRFNLNNNNNNVAAAACSPSMNQHYCMKGRERNYYFLFFLASMSTQARLSGFYDYDDSPCQRL